MGRVFEDAADVLVSTRGNLNTPQWPAIDGLGEFAGAVMHSARWDGDYDFTGKRIGVIGSGSSAIQIIPQLPRVPGARLTCFMRSRTWIAPPFGQKVQDRMGLGDDGTSDREQIQTFERDPDAWLDFRLRVEADGNSVHAVTLKGTAMQRAAQQRFEDGMRARLHPKPHYFDLAPPELRPRLPPPHPRPGLPRGPGPAQRDPHPRPHHAHRPPRRPHRRPHHHQHPPPAPPPHHHALDVLVCATGFHASAAPPFRVAGLHGTTLRSQWSRRATTYLSLAAPDTPNYFLMLGPNGAIGEGSLTAMIQATGDYIVKAIRKIQKERVKRMVVRAARVRDFLRYCDAYFRRTVFVDDCRSWYRRDGAGRTGDVVTGLWPGSGLHCLEALRSPRWEDYEYVYRAEEGEEANPMGWLGNGWVQNQLVPEVRDIDLGYYIMPQFQEYPRHPRPEEDERDRIQPWSY